VPLGLASVTGELVVIPLPGRSLVVERRLPMRTEPWPQGMAGVISCPVCGAAWRPWPGSFLPCHTACLFDERDQRRIVEVAMGSIRLAELAGLLGVTTSIVRNLTKTAKGLRTR
jgi:hypothetical protein